MYRLRHTLTGLLLLIFAVVPATAHHNTGALFNLDERVTIEGVVTRYEWKNPHLYFYVETNNNAGTLESWRVEAGPLALMRRIGWTRNTLSPGDKVVVTGSPSKRAGKTSAFLAEIVTPDGPMATFMSDAGYESLLTASDAREKAVSLEGTWATLLDVSVVGPIDQPEKLDLTDAGKSSIAAFDENTMHPGLECIPFTAPAMMLTPDYKKIEIADTQVFIYGEFDNIKRTVHLGADFDADIAPSLQGYSVGHWVGTTLKIETRRFLEHRTGIAFGLASSAQKLLIEEFELTDDGAALTYRFDLRDPVYLATPFTGEITWAYQPDVDYAIAECNLENSRLFLDE